MSESRIHELVREAWRNAEENGYQPDPSDEQEAISLADKYQPIEQWLWEGAEDPSQSEIYRGRFNELKAAVADIRRIWGRK